MSDDIINFQKKRQEKAAKDFKNLLSIFKPKAKKQQEKAAKAAKKRQQTEEEGKNRL